MKRDKTFILFGLDKGEHSPRGIFCLLVLFLGALFIAAVLSGPIYLLLSNMDSSVAQRMARRGICKIYDRIMLVTALISLPFFFKKCGLKKLSEIGCNFRNSKLILRWIGIGLLFATMVAGIEALINGTNVTCNPETLCLFVRKFPKFVLSSIVVGIFEEILFRGAILRAFYTACNPALAIIASSMFFAYVHIKIPLAAKVNGENIGILSGFRCIIPMLFGFLYEFKIFQFAKLTLFGIMLSMIALKNRSLNQAMGFHSGTVLMLFIASVFIR
ncbi:MAG: CPBP family intramembrane metalloprotease [Puniceicoccales bacterium]|nr:CPBP family intramembrane metalloprotease [Puniceicoccales bacterium]